MKRPYLKCAVKFLFQGLCIFSILFPLQIAKAQTLDQFQNIYNGGMSARTLAGYSEWQSFTAGLTGTLCQINMGFFNSINGSGTLKIFSGTGTAGVLRQSKTVGVFCASGSCLVSFAVSVPVIAGQVYTFQFIPGAGIPDPYGVQVQVPGTYGGGLMGLVDPSGTYPLTFDMVFQTYVNTGPLPVELILFTGKNTNHVNHLEWITASEINNQAFEVERSSDGFSFENIGIVEGNGNSSQILNYSFDDKHYDAIVNYYRLKQKDFNARFTYSSVITIAENNSPLEKIVYPNPAEQELTFRISLESAIMMNLKVTDAEGNVRMKETLSGVKGNNLFKLDISNLPQGIYFLNLDNLINQSPVKFVKL